MYTVFKYLIICYIIFQFSILEGQNIQTGVLIKKSKLLKNPRPTSGWHRIKLQIGDTLDVVSADHEKYYEVSYLDQKGWINKKKFNLLPVKKKTPVNVGNPTTVSATPSKTISNYEKHQESFFSKVSKIYSNIVFIISSTLLGILLFFSIKHYLRVRNFLHKTYSTMDKAYSTIGENIKSLKPEFSNLDLVPVGVSVFDIMYHMNKVDPLLISALDRLHHNQNFENFSELSGYVKSLIKGTTNERLIHKYKGYVGEEDTFDQLSSLSGSLFVPKSGTNPGFDFIYNGQKYDRATSSDSATIDRKLANLDDDVHVWVGSDIDEKYLNDSRVFIDKNSLTEREYFNITSDSFDGIDSIGNFINTIPFITMTLSSYNNYKMVSEGSKDFKTATEHVVLDTVGVGVGGYLGSQFGVRLGQILAPVTGGASAIIIPIATTVLGSIMGVITGKGIVNWFKERHYRRALRRIEEHSITFSKTYNRNAWRIINRHESKYEEKKRLMGTVEKEDQSLFYRIFFPNVTTMFFREARKKYRQELKNIKKYYLGLLKFTKRRKEKEKKEAGLILYAQGRDILLGHKNLTKCFNKIKNSMEIFESEKKKIGIV